MFFPIAILNKILFDFTTHTSCHSIIQISVLLTGTYNYWMSVHIWARKPKLGWSGSNYLDQGGSCPNCIVLGRISPRSMDTTWYQGKPFKFISFFFFLMVCVYPLLRRCTIWSIPYELAIDTPTYLNVWILILLIGAIFFVMFLVSTWLKPV